MSELVAGARAAPSPFPGGAGSRFASAMVDSGVDRGSDRPQLEHGDRRSGRLLRARARHRSSRPAEVALTLMGARSDPLFHRRAGRRSLAPAEDRPCRVGRQTHRAD